MDNLYECTFLCYEISFFLFCLTFIALFCVVDMLNQLLQSTINVVLNYLLSIICVGHYDVVMLFMYFSSVCVHIHLMVFCASELSL